MLERTPATVIGGRYKVLRELGRGGMGAVYLVEHLHTGEQLALKVLLAQAGANAELVERFKREARAPARIRSENVVRVTDADVAPELGGAPFMVMEALNGSDLEKVLQQRGALAPHEVMSILSQVAGALDKAHALGVTHRDLKPENLFLHTKDDGSTIVKILDFGISKIKGTEGNDIAQAGLTRTGTVMGTPLYMSPEQARGKASDTGPATDVWALGLIALHLLTGQIYWRADTIAELMVQILAEPMPPPSSRFPGLAPAFDAWFARSCDRDPAKRWPTVGEQVRALGMALGVTSASVPRVMISPASQTYGATGPQTGPMLGQTTAAPLAQSQPSSTTGAPSSTRRLPVAVVAFGALVTLGVVSAVGFVGWRATHAASSAPAPSAIAADADFPLPAVTSPPSAPPPPVVASAPTAPTASAFPVASIASTAPPQPPNHPAKAPHSTARPPPAAPAAPPAVSASAPSGAPPGTHRYDPSAP